MCIDFKQLIPALQQFNLRLIVYRTTLEWIYWELCILYDLMRLISSPETRAAAQQIFNLPTPIRRNMPQAQADFIAAIVVYLFLPRRNNRNKLYAATRRSCKYRDRPGHPPLGPPSFLSRFSFARRLSDYPCAGCKSGCLAQISASFRPIAMAMSSQMSQNLVSNFQIFASARIVRQPPRAN